jgi:hypothetical protein
MKNDPLYRNTYNLKQEDLPLEDTSLDMIPLGLSLANGIGRAAGGLGRIATDAINAPVNVARREGMRDIAKTGVGIGALAGGTANELIPGLGNIVMKKSAKKIPTLRGVNNRYKELSAFKQELPEILSKSGSISDNNLMKLLSMSKKLSKENIDKFKVNMAKFDNAEDELLKRFGYKFKDSSEFADDISKYKDYSLSRWTDNPSASFDIELLYKNNPEFRSKYGHLGGPEEIEKAFNDAERLINKKKNAEFFMNSNVDDSIKKLHKIKTNLRTSEKPVLSKDELTSEIQRQKGKALDYKKKLADDVKYYEDLIENGVEVKPGYFLTKGQAKTYELEKSIRKKLRENNYENPEKYLTKREYELYNDSEPLNISCCKSKALAQAGKENS